MSGQPLTVRIPGTQQRNFTHVNDIVEGLVLVGDRGTGDEFGLGSDELLSVLGLAKLFGSPIEMIPPRRGNRMGSTLDTIKSRALGWKAERHIADYVKQVVAGRVS